MPRIRTCDPSAESVAVLHRDPPPAKPITPARPTPKRNASEILDRLAADAKELLTATDDIVAALAQGQNPTPEERAILVARGLVGPRLDAEVSRLRRVLSFQGKAGTAADRDQDRQDAETAAAELASRGPEYEQQIAALHAKLSDLHANAERTAAIVDRQRIALDSLKNWELLPEQLVAELQDYSRAIQPLNARLNTLRNEIATTTRLAALPVEDAGVLAHAQAAKLACYRDGSAPKPGSSSKPHVDPAGWREYISRRQADDNDRRAELEQVETDLQPLIEKRESLLSHYVR